MAATSEDLWKATAVSIVPVPGTLSPPDLPSSIGSPSFISTLTGAAAGQVILAGHKNWVTNATADVNANNWLGFVTTGSTVISWSNTGNPGGAIRNVATPATGGAVLTYQNYPDAMPVQAGNVVALKGDINVVSGTFTQLILCARTFDSGGNFVGQPTVQLVTASTTGVWQTLSGTYTVPSGIAFVSFHIQVTCSNGSAITFDVDNASVTGPIPDYSWLLQYKPDSGVWCFLGGSPQSSEVDTSESRNANTYGDTATVHSLTLLRAGMYEFTYGFVGHTSSALNNEQFLSPQYSASAAIDADAAHISNSGTASYTSPEQGAMRCRRFYVASAGQVVTMRTRQSTASTSSPIARRFLKVVPIWLV